MAGVRTGLSYAPAIPVIQARGWRLELALELLRVIETAILQGDADERPE